MIYDDGWLILLDQNNIFLEFFLLPN